MMKYSLHIAILVCSFFKMEAQNLSVNLLKTDIECLLGKASIQIITGALPIQYLWSNGSVNSSIEELVEGDYSIKITADNSKDTIINFKIETLQCEPIPENHFTPNGDNYNDTWSINKINLFPDFELFVYNRWGQLVHYQKNEYIPWDGQTSIIPVPDATYYYMLYLSKKDRNKFVKGPVSIIR